MKYKLEKPLQAVIGKELYEMSVTWRNGSFTADEPAKTGGQDKGPDPYTLLLSSIATCTLATLRMYIDRKGWDIPQITVKANMFQSNKDGNTVTTFDRDLHFATPISQEQQEKLVEIANACPISAIIKGNAAIRTYVFNPEIPSEELKYANDEITVHWRPKICKHSGRCVLGLPSVFNLKTKPWVNIEGATTEQIIKQVEACPTGALTWSKKS